METTSESLKIFFLFLAPFSVFAVYALDGLAHGVLKEFFELGQRRVEK